MSLHVNLCVETPVKVKRGSGIFIRDNGATKEITEEEWNALHPDMEPYRINYPEEEVTDCVYTDNITHNLNRMADAAGIYKHLWRPEEVEITKASELIPPLTYGLAELQSYPDKYKEFDSPNCWGVYDNLVTFVRDYLQACIQYPDAIIRISR